MDSKLNEKSLDQLSTVGSMFEKEFLTLEEFSAAKKKYCRLEFFELLAEVPEFC